MLLLDLNRFYALPLDAALGVTPTLSEIFLAFTRPLSSERRGRAGLVLRRGGHF